MGQAIITAGVARKQDNRFGSACLALPGDFSGQLPGNLWDNSLEISQDNSLEISRDNSLEMPWPFVVLVTSNTKGVAR